MWKEIVLWLFLAIVTIIDLKTRKVNIGLCVLFGVLGMVFVFCSQNKDWTSAIGGMAVGAYLLVFACLTKEAIGVGDGLAVAAAGIWIGGGFTLAVLMGGFVMAAVFGFIKIMTGKASGKTELAFMPFFSLSYVVLYLGGLR